MKTCIMLLLAAVSSLHATVLHHPVGTTESVYEWVVDEAVAFDELVVSWNAIRPKVGKYEVSVQIKTDTWTEDLLYAIWDANFQRTFTTKAQNGHARTNEDTVELLQGRKATGFKVKIEAKDGASLRDLWALHASMCEIGPFKEKIAQDTWKAEKSVHIPVVGRSQIALDHIRNMSLCSPTSTSAVLTHLVKKEVAPIDFAAKVHDSGFDIYGKWNFNVAMSADVLGNSWHAYMARFASFDVIYKQLERGIPTVVSVRGTLTGAIHPYPQGHLIAVVGYDAESDRVLCMDPAYPTDAETLVCYDRQEFLQSCARRGYIGYFFDNLTLQTVASI
ncbi:MAG: C39 family peptidase [Chlamydiales bacterium]|nr:C39 family peptidase [Chlamydiales bacterium]